MRKDKIEPTLTFSCSTISVYLLKIRVGTVKNQILEKPNRSGRVFQIIVASTEYMNFNLSQRSKILSVANINICSVLPFQRFGYFTTKKKSSCNLRKKPDLSNVPKLKNLRLNSIEFIMHSHMKGGYRKKID